MADPLGAVVTIIDLIGTVCDLVDTEKEKWGRYKELPESFEKLLRELNACDEQWNDFKNSYKWAEGEYSEDLKRSYVKLIISQKDKLDGIKAYLKDLKTKIPKSRISSGFRQWFKARSTDRSGVVHADDTSEMISKFVGDLQKLSRECHEEMKGLDEKRGDQYTPYFYTPRLENIILKMNDDKTAEGKLKKGVMTGGEATAVLGTSLHSDASYSGRGGTTSVEGLGGIGKTKALHGLANDEDVKKKFQDGVLFMTFGKKATDKKLKENFCMIVRQSGGKKLSKSIENNTLEEVIDETAKWFKDKNTLFVCDDLWPTALKNTGYLNEITRLKQSSSTCHLVLSTRYGKIASKACNKSGTVIEFRTLDSIGRRAQEVLLRYANVSDTDFESLSDNEKRVIGGILQQCGGLYFALAVAGGILLETKQKQSLASAVEKLYYNLTTEKKSLLDGDVDDHDVTLYRCFETSLELVHEWAKTQGLGDCCSKTISRLCVYQKTTKLTVEMMNCLWLVKSHVDPLVEKLRDFHLLEEEKDAELYTFHDLFHDFCVRKAGGNEEVLSLHCEFLDNVTKRCGVVNLGQSSAERVCGRLWWNLKDGEGIEGYMRSNLARHLKEAGKVDELAALMTRFEWTLFRFRKNDYNGMMNDLSIWVEEEEKRWREGKENRNEYIKKRQLRQAISSAWSKSDNEEELACHVLGQLLDSRAVSKAAKSYIDSVEGIGMHTWLRPLQQFWDAPSGDVIGVQFIVKDISVNWETNQAIVLGDEGDIALLNLSALTVNKLNEDENQIVTCVAWSKNGGTLISGSYKGDITLWNVTNWQAAQTMCNVGCNVESVAVSDDGSRVAFSCDDTVRVWDLQKNEELWVLEGHQSMVHCVAMNKDGSLVASGSADLTVRIWDVEQKEQLCVFEGHKRNVRSVAMSGDGSRAASCSLEKNVIVWDVEKMEQLCVLAGHFAFVDRVSMSADGSIVLSGGGDHTFRAWDVEERRELFVLGDHDGRVASVAMSDDGSRVVSGSWDSYVRVWDVKGLEELCGDDWYKARNVYVAMSKDGSRVAFSSLNGSVYVWDAEKREKLCVLEGHAAISGSVALSGDGSRVAYGCQDQTVCVWDVEMGEEMCEFEGNEDEVNIVAMSEDGSRVASGSDDLTVRIWDVEKKEQLCEFEGHEGPVVSVAISEDGNRVASGSDDNTVRIWDVEKKKQLCKFEGSDDNTVRIWDVEKKKQLCKFEGHESHVKSVAISGDGSRVVSIWDNSTVCVWDVEKMERLCEFGVYNGRYESVAMSGDGRFFASQLECGFLMVFKVVDDGNGQINQQDYMLFRKAWLPRGYGVSFIGQQMVIGIPNGRSVKFIVVP